MPSEVVRDEERGVQDVLFEFESAFWVNPGRQVRHVPRGATQVRQERSQTIKRNESVKDHIVVGMKNAYLDSSLLMLSRTHQRMRSTVFRYLRMSMSNRCCIHKFHLHHILH